LLLLPKKEVLASFLLIDSGIHVPKKSMALERTYPFLAAITGALSAQHGVISMSSEPDTNILAPSGASTLRDAAELRSSLLTALRGNNVVLDCTAITEVDLSFVQLVLAARKSAGPDRFTVNAPPTSALAETLIRGGFCVGADRQVPADPALWCAPSGAA